MKSDKVLLKELSELVLKLRSTTKKLEKIEILKDLLVGNTELQKLISMVLDDIYLNFSVRPKSMKKHSNLVSNIDHGIIDLLYMLDAREYTGHKAISVANGLVQRNPEHTQLIYQIFERNLEIGTDKKTFNKVIPGMVPEFEVALGTKYEPKLVQSQDWLISQKLDGVRCLIFIDEQGKVKPLSRKGKPIDNIEPLIDSLKSQDNFNRLKGLVLDGELCYMNEDGSENFKEISRRIRMKDSPIPLESIKFLVFDVLTKKEFDDKKSIEILSKRLNRFPIDQTSNIEVLEQISLDKLDELIEKSDSSGWEGLILRKDAPYQGKRSKDILKYKKMYDDEYTIKDLFFGPFPYVIKDENGNNIEIREEMLSHVTILHKGEEVRVGSGFSIDERRHYKKHPEDLKDKVATIQYFEESMDRNGKLSLRFPIIKQIHGESREH